MIVVAGRSEVSWDKSGEADIALAMSMQPDDVAKTSQ